MYVYLQEYTLHLYLLYSYNRPIYSWWELELFYSCSHFYCCFPELRIFYVCFLTPKINKPLRKQTSVEDGVLSFVGIFLEASHVIWK